MADNAPHHTRPGLLVAALVLGMAILAAHTSGGTARAGGACSDPTQNAGGELEFQGVGTPDHLAVAEGDVCPAASEVWTFSHLPITLDQYVGVRVFQHAGSISISVLTPRGQEMALAPGEEFHTRSEGTYHVTVTGGGTGLSLYRLEVCRSISPCRFIIGQAPGPPGPTDLSPPSNLTPPEHCYAQDTDAPSPLPPTYFSTPTDRSPPGTYVCLPSTGSGGSTSSTWLRLAAFAVGTVAALVVVFAGLSAALDRRRD